MADSNEALIPVPSQPPVKEEYCRECDFTGKAPKSHRHEDGCECTMDEKRCAVCHRMECIHAREECRVSVCESEEARRIDEAYYDQSN